MAPPLDPLGGLQCDTEALTRFVGKLREPDDPEDLAEIGRLLAATTSRANAAFLSSFLPPASTQIDAADAVRDAP